MIRLLSKISRAVYSLPTFPLKKIAYDFVFVVDHQGKLVHIDEVAHLVEIRHVCCSQPRTNPTSGEVNHRVSVAVVEGKQRRRVGLEA